MGSITGVEIEEGGFSIFDAVIYIDNFDSTCAGKVATMEITATDYDGNIYSSGIIANDLRFPDVYSIDDSGVLNFGSFDDGTWTAAAPEPTSGILLLLGMGAIALKRKRA